MASGTDDFGSNASGLDSPAKHAVAVTPHNTDELPKYSRGLYVGGAGDVSCILAGDSIAVVFENVVAGSILPVRAKIVTVSDTSATAIIALY